MTRDNFRASVFNRDGNRCVICCDKGQDAHHILERRLFSDGGYYVDNGVTLCGNCHLKAESTDLSPQDLLDAAGITKFILPEHLYSDQEYTKWGDPVLENGQRLKGELFEDESVQKIIKPFLHLYTNYVKYPRTYHLPWSKGVTDDDKVMQNPSDNFNNIVVTEKMDGENTTMYRDYIHARSIDGRNHPSRDWVKNFHAQIAHDIPEGWRICGENLYATHQIKYDDLSTYFLGFSVWNEKNVCLDWNETLEWFDLLGITPVRDLYSGIFDKEIFHEIWKDYSGESEGYIVRNFDSFHYKDFRYNVDKYVKANFVAGRRHWMYGQRMDVNGLLQR